jgi:protein TonB
LNDELSEKGLKVVTDEDNFSPFFGFVEQMPEFPGGEEELRKFINDNLVYPKEAKENRKKGTIFIGFIVEKDGSISNVKVEHDLGYGLGEEAVRVGKMMPKWKPGKQGGENVAVKFTIPISFTAIFDNNWEKSL